MVKGEVDAECGDGGEERRAERKRTGEEIILTG